jgi:hypothetical protein
MSHDKCAVRWGLVGLGLVILFAFLLPSSLRAADECSVCGTNLEGKSYLMTDKVTNEQKQVCTNCITSTQICYMCGMPVGKTFMQLPDTRLLCERDSNSVVQDPAEAKAICAGVKSTLTLLLSRYMVMPGTNVTFNVADRVAMQEIFKTPGNGVECPNTMGCTRSKADKNHIKHEITVLSGLPAPYLRATCAHELTHAWMNENLSAKRRGILSKDAVEGFCEFIAYYLMDTEHEEDQKQIIRRNAYTHGQVDLYIQAEAQYGLYEVVQWVRLGVDPELEADDLWKVRSRGTFAAPTWSTNLVVPVAAKDQAQQPETLALTGLLWSRERPVALINNIPFRPGQEGPVIVGKDHVDIRCVEIRTNSVVIKTSGSSDTQELTLKGK